MNNNKRLGGNLERIYKVKKDINELLYHEEVFWRQRSRSIWLPVGNKNTKNFHQRASQRRCKNHIEGLHDNQGVWHTDERRIDAITEDYYKEVFTSSNPSNTDGVLNLVKWVVMNGMNQTLTQSYTKEEVRVALFQMHPLKAPRPNGMSPFFFRKYWHIVELNITSAIISILNSSKCLHKMNYTHIVLIPKKNNPQYVTEYWLISLSNVVSRIVSKVLANCLKIITPKSSQTLRVHLRLKDLSLTTL